MLALSPGHSVAWWLFYVLGWPLLTDMAGGAGLVRGTVYAKCLWRVLRPLLDPKGVIKAGL